MTGIFTRRDFALSSASLAASALLPWTAWAQSPDALITRAIPGSGERVPVVGLGTASVFDNSDDATRRAAGAVIKTLADAGGRIIDTASSYGSAETVIGDV
ncbi:MAG TPA: aldo/keto reductase, partial [Stellaceae bacterium]|nr:aldo/keto reductase [Stellaceae bacterium]